MMIASDILDLDAQPRTQRYYSESSGYSSPNSHRFSPGVVNSPEHTYQNLAISTAEPIFSNNNTVIGTNIYCSLPAAAPHPAMQLENGCRLTILEEPSDKFRFRYISEMHGTHGSLMGRNNIKSKKTHPQVRLDGFHGHGFIRCSLYQMDLTNPSPHSHLLVVRKDDRDVHDPHDVEISPDRGGYEVKFQGMGIIHTAKKDISKELFAKKVRLYKFQHRKDQLSMKEQQLIKDQTEREEKSMNLNQVRLCFEAFQHNPDGSCTQICEPVFSQPINNMKSALTGELKISRLSAAVSSAAGGDDLMLLVEKVGKKNIKVRFYELDDDDETSWEDYGQFSEADVHHQYAITLRTPQYKNRDIVNSVDVFIQLVRPSDNVRSDSVPFKYKPRHTITSRKRRRISGSSGSLSSFEIPEPVARVANSEDGNLTISEEFNKSACLDEIMKSTNQTSLSGAGFVHLMQFVEKNINDNIPSLWDTDLTSFELDKLECDSAGGGDSKEYRRKTSSIQIGTSTESQHLTIIFKRFIDGLNSHRDLKDIRCEIIEIWNDSQKFNESGDDILHSIIAQNDYKIAMKLFHIITKLDMHDVLLNQNQRGESLLHTTCLYNKVEFIRVLLRLGCNANSQDAKGNTALHIAVAENFANCVKTILSMPSKVTKLNVNLANDDGLTALHLAIKTGNFEIVKLLIDIGDASVEKTISKNGNTALHLAVEHNRYDIISYLLKAGNVQRDQKNSSGFTALDLAKAIDAKSQIVELFLSLHFKETPQKNDEAVPMNEEDSDNDSDSDKTLQIDENEEETDLILSLSTSMIKELTKILDSNSYWKRLATILDLEHLTCLWISSESLLEHLNKEKICKRQQFIDALQEIDKSLADDIAKKINE